MKSLETFNLFFITFFFLLLFIAFIVGAIVLFVWMGWSGGWLGVTAVITSFYFGVVSHALK